MVIKTVSQKGMPALSNTAICKTPATRKSRNEEPTKREMIKKNAPVLYA